MGELSKIEWTDHTFNSWWGCQKVSEGCKHCYAETLDKRWAGNHWGPGSDRKPMSEKYWAQPLKWNEAARAAGIPAKVFCSSMADVFEDHPQVTEHRERLFDLIMLTPYLTWQLLTKRPENILKFVPNAWQKQFPENVWIGMTTENQETLEERWPHFQEVNATATFLSCEPLLGPINLPIDCADGSACIDWVIAGGESGHGARPVHPDWIRGLRDQCQASGTAFFFKQWGEWRQYDHQAGDNAKPLGMFENGVFRKGNIIWDHKRESVHMAKVGKKEAGRILDGRTWDEFPNDKSVNL